MKLPDRMPTSIAALPRNKAGYPVPWFVAKVNGDWDFRIVRQQGVQLAVSHHLCWTCGQPLDAGLDAFLIGPMCAVNHVSAEPPSHLACARWAAIACPFLARPEMVRREHGMPTGHIAPAGVMISRNPGAVAVWAVRRQDWDMFRVGAAHGASSGVLFNIGDAPRRIEWYARGRKATRDEASAALDSGLPLLVEAASVDGPEALHELTRLHQQAIDLLPA